VTFNQVTNQLSHGKFKVELQRLPFRIKVVEAKPIDMACEVRTEGRDRRLDKAITFLMKLIENTSKLDELWKMT